jgi:subtilisin family serine protease
MRNNSRSLLRSRFVNILLIGAVIAAPALAQTVDPGAQQLISQIVQQKTNFTAGENKMDSQLVFAAKLARGELAGFAWAPAATNPQVDSQGMVVVDINGTVSDSLINQVTVLGGQVLDQSASWGAIRAIMPLLAVESLATNNDVSSISTKADSHTNRIPLKVAARFHGSPLLQREPQKLRAMRSLISQVPSMGTANSGHPSLHSWFSPSGLAFFIGSLTTQGYVSHRANQVVQGMGINGNGVKVGVLSDSASATRIAALIATGDLPPNVTVLPGQAGSGADEGAAMMEIIHDIAPGAQLYFARANGGVTSFANNIIALQQAGCQIIVDDFTYFNEGAFQDGPIARAVNQVTQAGVLYFSSAANSGSVDRGTSGTWEGDFLDDGTVSVPEAGHIHSFNGKSAGTGQDFDVLTVASSFISLKWSDPLGASSNDYDLFVLDSTGTSVKAFSIRRQTGTQDPYEFVSQGVNCGTSRAQGYCPVAGDRIVVVKFAGAQRALRIDTNRGQLSIATPGSTYGHNAGANTVSAAATFWNSARTGTQPFAPFRNQIETFSSDGPRKIFYNPDGTAITPGNFLFGTNGGTTLLKPDLTGADGVTTKTLNFNPFYGTSAAAPHLAGVAALIKSAKPSLTNVQIRQIMINTATDQMAPGWDRDSGYGTADALAGVQAALQ